MKQSEHTLLEWSVPSSSECTDSWGDYAEQQKMGAWARAQKMDVCVKRHLFSVSWIKTDLETNVYSNLLLTAHAISIPPPSKSNLRFISPNIWYKNDNGYEDSGRREPVLAHKGTSRIAPTLNICQIAMSNITRLCSRPFCLSWSQRLCEIIAFIMWLLLVDLS